MTNTHPITQNALTGADLKSMNRTRADVMVFIGVDLGERRNPSAIVVLERFEEWPANHTDILRGAGPKRRYVVRQAERIPLGTPYTEVIRRVKHVVERIASTGRHCVLIVDEGGPGIPVVERMREAGMGCSLIPYTITADQAATGSTVSRTILLTKLQMMVESGELEIAAGCRDSEHLERELIYLQLDGKCSGESDDLAMALALACWKARVR